jgi:hypothetical protein
METNEYLTKTYKGRYIELFESFILSLDADYQWQSFHFSMIPKNKRMKQRFYFIYINNPTHTLLLVNVHPVYKGKEEPFIQVKVDGAETVVRKSNFYIVEKVFSKEIQEPLNDLEEVMMAIEEPNL